MGVFDKLRGKAKDLAGEHSEKIDKGLQQAGDTVDKKTSGKYTEQVDQGVEKAQRAADSFTEEKPG
jgi:MT0933-like antitoxin protein